MQKWILHWHKNGKVAVILSALKDNVVCISHFVIGSSACLAENSDKCREVRRIAPSRNQQKPCFF